MNNETVIDILDEVFQDRDYDLTLLSKDEFEELSQRLTLFASNYEAPPRSPGESRYYAGGTAWNTGQECAGKIWFGPAGLQYGGDMAVAQTFCLMHDSVVCHDPVTDLLGAHRTDILPKFFENIFQGEVIADSNCYGVQPLTKTIFDDAAARLNPTMRVYDVAREFIQRGYLIPVPTRILLRKKAHAISTQIRQSARDARLLQVAAKSKTIPVFDGAINMFIAPSANSKMSVGPTSDNPVLRLHYGLMHHLKCLLVAHKSSADFAPMDDFGWQTLSYKYEELARILRPKSSMNCAHISASSALAIPMVSGFSIYDIIGVRRDEEVFEELRKILRQTTQPQLVSVDLEDFYRDYESQVIDALEQWKAVVSTSSKKRNLFRNISLVAGAAISTVGEIVLNSSDPSGLIVATGGLPGFYYLLNNLLTAGQDPEQRLSKILRRYSFPE